MHTPHSANAEFSFEIHCGGVSESFSSCDGSAIVMSLLGQAEVMRGRPEAEQLKKLAARIHLLFIDEKKSDVVKEN